MLEFDGCYFHGHRCTLTSSVNRDILKERAERTRLRAQYLREAGYDVISMKECIFKEICQNDPKLREKLKQVQRNYGYNCPFTVKNPGCVKESEILDAIRDGSLYGFILSSVEVPENWSPEFEGRYPMKPSVYFGEMSPVFATCEVRRTDVGVHMQQFMDENEIADKSKRLLVGGSKGKNLLISTELAQWYLNRGLRIHNISIVLEFEKKAYLSEFCRDVTESRRLASRDPDKLVLANQQKLLGNSCYGKYSFFNLKK